MRVMHDMVRTIERLRFDPDPLALNAEPAIVRLRVVPAPAVSPETKSPERAAAEAQHAAVEDAVPPWLVQFLEISGRCFGLAVALFVKLFLRPRLRVFQIEEAA